MRVVTNEIFAIAVVGIEIKMRFVFLIILALSATGASVYGQRPIAPEDKPNIAKAEKTADDFFRRVARAKNFERVWKLYRAADYACFLTDNPFEPEGDAVFTSGERESYVIAAMALSFLTSAYGYSVARMNDGPSQKFFPDEVRRAAKTAKYFRLDYGEDEEPPNPKDSAELKDHIIEMKRFSRMFQRAMPRNATNNAIWRWNMKKMRGVGGNTYAGVLEGSAEDCVLQGTKLYIIQRGPFQFWFTKELGRMKIAQIGLGN